VSAIRIALCAAAFAAAASSAFAQAAPAPTGRVEISGGVLWIGDQALGSSNANETTGSGGQLALFNTSTTLASAVGAAARIDVRVWRSLAVEASGSYATPELRTTVSADFENAAPVTATERLQQFTVAGSLAWDLVSDRSARLVPFVIGGGGYLRQLHARDTLADTGQFYQIGGGVKYDFSARRASRVKGFGIRADVLAVVRVKGVAFDDGAHVSPAIAASVFARF
jgi:opacity protein-like surface antigen